MPEEMRKASTPASTIMGAVKSISSMPLPPGSGSAADIRMRMGKSRPTHRAHLPDHLQGQPPPALGIPSVTIGSFVVEG